jgi:hypothetical protein
MNNKFPIYLAKIEISPNGDREFVKDSTIYKEAIWGTPYNKFFFKLRKAFFNKANCNFNCPPGREFFCCKSYGCQKNCGFFEWDEISFFSEEQQAKILSSWNSETGFLIEDGCALPREFRSYICLSFSCKHGRLKE